MCPTVEQRQRFAWCSNSIIERYTWNSAIESDMFIRWASNMQMTKWKTGATSPHPIKWPTEKIWADPSHP